MTETSQDPGDVACSFQDDDLDLCLYYLQSVANVLRWGPDPVWKILASTTLSTSVDLPAVARIGKTMIPYLPIH